MALRIVKPSAVALGSLSAGLGTQRANFRLISATHKPLQQMVADGRFRQDLYYRISAFPIYLSPLRERTADIPMLVDSFLQRGSSAKHRIRGRARRDGAPAIARLARQHPGVAERVGAGEPLCRRRRRAGRTSAGLRERWRRPFRNPGMAGTPPRSDGKDVVELKGLLRDGRYTRFEMAQRMGVSERTLNRRLKALGLA